MRYSHIIMRTHLPHVLQVSPSPLLPSTLRHQLIPPSPTMMKFPLLSTAIMLLLSFAQADIQPGKPTLNNNNYYWTNALVQQMPLPSHTITKWPWGTVPHKCVRNTIDNNQTPCDP